MRSEIYECQVILVLFAAGVVSVPGSAGGYLLGSVLIKRLSLTVEQQLRAMFFFAIVCLAAMVMFVVQCDTAPLAQQYTSQSNM